MALGSLNPGDFATSFRQLCASHEVHLSLEIITKFHIYISDVHKTVHLNTFL